MNIQPTTMHWLQNNNNNTPQRQQNQLRPGPGPGGRPNGNGPTPPAGPSLVNRWLLIVVGVMLAVYIFMYFNTNTSVPNSTQRDELSYSAFYDQMNSGNIKTATFIGTTDIQGNFNHPVNGYSQYHVVQLPNGDPQIVSALIKSGATVVNQPPPDNSFWVNLLITFLPWLFLIGLFIFFSRRATQGQQGIFSFGKSRAKLILEDRPSTTFADVAGVDESKYELQEVFIDEIDAVARQRGMSINSNDEREQTLNQLLVEMDGFDTHQAVVVIGATNRPDGLDIALLRPGRFDRRVTVDRPDWNGRLAILKIHTRNVPLASDVDLVALARSTPGMVGADLANLVNEAALLAARRNLDRVTQRSFEEALDKILLGAERPIVLTEEDLNVIAYHESGHALTALLSKDADPVQKVTIVARGQALGVTMSVPLDDRYNYSKEYLLTQMVTLLGGRAAEKAAIGRITTGAENDLQRVTALARQMVTRWGMSERLGTISFSERSSPFLSGSSTPAPSDYSETTAEAIDEEVERIVTMCYNRAIELLTSHRPTLDRMVQELRKHETINAQQLQQIMEETGAEIASPQSLPPKLSSVTSSLHTPPPASLS